MPTDSPPRRPAVKLPPVPGATGAGRAPSGAKAAAGPGGAAPPRLNIGTASTPPAAGPGSQPPARTAAPAAPAATAAPRVAIGTVGAKPAGGAAAPGASVQAPPAAGPSAPSGAPRVKTARPRKPAKRPDRRPREGGLKPGHTVRDLRRPVGTVRSDAAVANVMRATLALVDVLEAENAALRKHDVKAVKGLLDRKEAATRLYRQKMLEIQKDPSRVTGLPEDERDVVRETAQYLDAHLAENGRLLKSAQACGERLMGLFVDAVRDASTEKAPGYAANGRLTEQAHMPARMSLTYNENL